ncbi:alternate-type signal peptide domain-containing protein [Leucobacter sp. 1207-22]|uniref:alternate-type signal peptide domain-containing protein n=1 Tax=Leucobacter sp. 1207-22 TaxID=2604456 RepID=UPI004063CA9D
MKKSTAGIVAAVAGGALLLGGSTFALWSDSVKEAGGQITAGNLDVNLVGTTWQDVSGTTPKNIDLATFKIVPGDTIKGSFAVDLALKGDNLNAELRLSENEALQGALASGLVGLKYEVKDAATGKVVAANENTAEAALRLAPGANTFGDVTVNIPASLGGNAELLVDVTVTFDPATSARDLTETTATLASTGIELVQVR